MRIQKDHVFAENGMLRLDAEVFPWFLLVFHFCSESSRCACSYVMFGTGLMDWHGLKQWWVHKVDGAVNTQVPLKERRMPDFPFFVSSAVQCVWNWQASSLFCMTSCEGLTCFVQPKAEEPGKQQTTAELPRWHGACTCHSSPISYLMLISYRYCVFTSLKTMGVLFLQIYLMRYLFNQY